MVKMVFQLGPLHPRNNAFGKSDTQQTIQQLRKSNEFKQLGWILLATALLKLAVKIYDIV